MTAEAQLRGIPGHRGLADDIVSPAYPRGAIRANITGLVVAEICVPPGARSASTIWIMTAPDKALADAARDAIRRWRFAPVTKMGDPSAPLSYAAKITWYFVRQGNEWRVLSPADSFYVGSEFAMRQQEKHYSDHPAPPH